MFSIITMASSTTKPVEIVSAINVRLFETVARQIHHAKRADNRKRHGNAGDDGRRQIAQEQENHHHHQRNREHQLELNIRHRRANGDGAVGEHIDLHRRRQIALQQWAAASLCGRRPG